MKLFPIAAALFAILPLALLGACGDDGDDGPPIQLQQADSERISAMATAYVAALQARDMTAAKALIVKGVPEATITKSMNTVRDEGFKLVSIGQPTVDGQDVVVLVELTDKDGKAVTRKLEFKQDGGAWVVYSPHLKPL